MSSSKENPLGEQFNIPISQGINLDQVNENILPISEGVGPHLTNTGILRDNGVTNLYETSATDSNGQIVMYAPNGKKISINTASSSITVPSDIYVDGVKMRGCAGFWGVSSRVIAPYGAVDIAVSTTGTWLLLTKVKDSTPLLVYRVLEYDPSTKTVTGSKDIASGGVGILAEDYVCFVKTFQMTLANADIANIVFTNTTVDVGVFVSGVRKSAFSGPGKPLSFMGISAFSRGGTYIVGGVTDNASMPRSYYAASPYAVWTAVNEASFLAPFKELNYTTITGTPSLSLYATPSNISTANYTSFSTTITISSAGVVTVTPATVAGLTIVPSDTYTGWGFASGRYKSTAATKFSAYIACVDANPSRADQTVTDYAVKPEGIATVKPFNTARISMYTKSGIPTQVVFSDQSGNTPGCILCEYGSVADNAPIIGWSASDTGTNQTIYVSIPIQDGVMMVTLTPLSYSIYPISKDVVQLNDSRGCIIDTARGIVEYNTGAQSPSFHGDMYLAGTNQLAWQTFGKYSNAPDVGLVLTAAGSAAGVAGFTTAQITINKVGSQSGFTFFQSATGTLFAINRYLPFNGSEVATDTTVAYVQNSNLPAPADAVFKDGGISLLQRAALQTINFSDSDGFAQYYAGYTLANQYPVAYQFFNLFGQLYGFDGTKIFRMPINGAIAGTPEQVAITTGMTFVANSPTIAWFWSSYDNTLYAFTGGASVDHWQPMTGVGLVSSGVFNIRENALYLQLADNTTLIFRDGLPGLLANAFTSQTTFSTDLGVYFVDNSAPNNSKTWTYYAGSGTPITLTWQSGYFGFGNNRYVRLTHAVFAFKVTDPATTNITINYKALTDGVEIPETATSNGGAYTASPAGYVRIQFNPTQALTYGFSLGFSCTKKIVLYEVTAYYTDGGVGPVQNRIP